MMMIRAGKWGLKELEFYRESGCSGTNINNGVPIDSGHATDTTGPEKAFDEDENTKWGGRYEEGTDEMWIGMEFESPEKFLCAFFSDDNKKFKSTNFVKIQAYNDNSGTWIDMASANHEYGARQNIEIKSGPGPAPTPTNSPGTPTLPPVKGPTSECVNNDEGIYFYHSSFGGNERDIFDDCTKLDDKKDRQLKEICKWTKSGEDKGVTYGPAREVCRKRCGTCSGGPTGPAPTPTPPTASKAPNNLKEKYIKNETGNISYKKMKNRNPDCSDYSGSYFAVVENTQSNADLKMDFEIKAEANKCVLISNNIPNHDVVGSI